MEFLNPDKSRIHFPLKKKSATSSNDKKFSVESQVSTKTKKSSFIPKLDELISNAEVLIHGKEYDLAKNLLGRSLQFYPKNLDLLELLAKVSTILSDWEMVEKCYYFLSKVDYSEDNIIGLCEALEKTGQLSKARVFYEELLSRINLSEKNQFRIYKDLGNLSLRDNDFEAAEEYYNKAFTLNHKSDALLVNFGTLELQRDQYDEALKRFREALEINIKNSKAWVGLAMIHRHYGDFDLSYANISSAIDSDPYNRSALKLFADWSASQGKTQLAIERLVDYTKAFDQDDEILLVLAKVYFIDGQYQMACLETEKVFSLNPANTEAMEFLKVCKNYCTQAGVAID